MTKIFTDRSNARRAAKKVLGEGAAFEINVVDGGFTWAAAPSDKDAAIIAECTARAMLPGAGIDAAKADDEAAAVGKDEFAARVAAPVSPEEFKAALLAEEAAEAAEAAVKIGSPEFAASPEAKANAESWDAIPSVKRARETADAAAFRKAKEAGKGVVTDELLAEARGEAKAETKKGESKLSLLLAAARRPEGVTIKAAGDLTGWSKFGGFFTAVKKQGLSLTSRKVDGLTTWFVSGADEQKAA